MSQLPILVTGATGLVGNNVVRRLVERGAAVRVLARPGFQARVFDDLELDIAPGDICSVEDVRRACHGAGGVIHAAGYVQLGWSRLETYRSVNIEGTRNVAVVAREAGVRMVHVSSCDALGVCSLTDPADEDTPFAALAPIPYAVTKAQAECAVLEEVARGLNAVIVNPGFMLGPWDWKPSSGRMLLAVARGQGWFAPTGHFNVCDVRDVADGILAALDRGRTGRRYILGGETMSYLDAWRLFADVIGVRRPLCRIGPVVTRLAGWGGDLWGKLSGNEPDVNSAALALAKLPKHYTSDRARRELGYAPRPFSQAVQDAWAWFVANGYATANSP
jgi:dihydroflavonol-4-reductase